MHRTLRFLTCALVVASVTPAAPAKEPAKAPSARSAKAPKLDTKRFQKVFDAGSEAEVLAALAELGALGPAAVDAAPLVNALLVRGGSAPLSLAALEAAGAIAAPASSEAVAPYVAHRKPELREAAARTLALTGGPAASASLRRALAGPDPVLRGIAASGLGTLGAKEALPDLFKVLERNTPQAAVAVAKLCTADQCDALLGLVGKIPFDTLEASFVPLLLRPATEVPDANKLRTIDRLRRLATKRASAILSTALAQLPKDQSDALRSALQIALRERPVTGDSK